MQIMAAAANLTIGAGSYTASGLSSRTFYSTSNGTSLRTSLAKSAGFSRRAGHGVVQCSMEQADEGNAKVRHGHVPRRLAIALIAGAAAVISKTNPAEAAYGEAANIFAPLKAQSGFKSYVGDGFKVDVPAKWNPSKEVEFPGQVLRYEDNFDVMSNLSVSILKAEKSSMKDYGSPEEFLKSIPYVLGKQSYSGKTFSEGGFEGGKVATASILDSEVKESNGKTYYGISVLTRTADGDEGGKHQLIVATIDGGKLFLLKAQAGDKRWFKGTKKFVEGVVSSFNVV